MKLLVTGASGQYGRAALDGLLEQVPAQDLIALTRTPSKLEAYAARGVEVRHGDFDDGPGLIEALHGAERMLMISTGRVGRRVPQHQRAIEAARAAGVGHIVYTSFIGISDENPALVIRDHGPTEALLAASGMAYTALRDSQYSDALVEAVGPNAVAAGEWHSATGEGYIALVTRADCVACAVAVLTGAGHENRIYNITGPDRLRHSDAVAIIAEIAGKAIRYIPVSEDEMYARFDAMGIPRESIDDHMVKGFAWSSEDMVSFEAAIRTGHFDVISDDVERLLGRKPESFRAFALRHADMLRATAA